MMFGTQLESIAQICERIHSISQGQLMFVKDCHNKQKAMGNTRKKSIESGRKKEKKHNTQHIYFITFAQF